MRSLQKVRGEFSEDHREFGFRRHSSKEFLFLSDVFYFIFIFYCYFYPMYINGKYKERQPDGILETFYVTHPISTILGNITSG